MKFVLAIAAFIVVNSFFDYGFLSSAAVALSVGYIAAMVQNMNSSIPFREYILVMYAVNYLFSPALIYHVDQSLIYINYRMRLNEDDYFSLAIPAILLLHAGLYCLRTPIFRYNFAIPDWSKEAHVKVFKQWIIIGICCRVFNEFLPGDIAFLFYLLGGFRFVAAFALFKIDRKKYKWYILVLMAIEVSFSLQQGMFADVLIWLIFFGLYWFYVVKPNLVVKAVIGVAALFLFYIIQISKSDYRSAAAGNGGLSTFQTVALKNVNSQQGLFNPENLVGSLTRINQSWILASTIRRMDYKKDFQGFDLMNKYLEAAVLPRVLAPNKLKAGDNAIFNQFSGVRVSSGTSMGLGFFADGYVSYGQNGLFAFAFALGLCFALVFKLVERWGRISPFFVLFFFVILNYAIRPDCETQTMLGHLIKGVIVFSLVMLYYKKYFVAPEESEMERSHSPEMVLAPSL